MSSDSERLSCVKHIVCVLQQEAVAPLLGFLILWWCKMLKY